MNALRLTEREEEVVTLLARGYTATDVAARCDLSRVAISQRMRAAKRRNHVATTMELVAKWSYLRGARGQM